MSTKKTIAQTRPARVPVRSGTPLPGADGGQPVDAAGVVIPPEQRQNVALSDDRGPGTDQPPPPAAAPGGKARPDLSRPDAKEKVDIRKELAAKARRSREALVTRAEADHPDVAAAEEQVRQEMSGERLMPGDPGYEMPPTDEEAAAAAAAGGAPPPSTAAQLAAQAQGAAPAPDPTASGNPPPAAQPVDNGENYVTVKVYGVDRRVSKAVVDAAGGITTYQKNLAAEIRMQQAATLQRENEAERQRLATERENLGRQQATPPGTQIQPPNPGAGADRKARALQITRTLFSGNEEATAAAIEELLGTAGTGQAHLNPDQVAEKAVQMLEQRNTERSSANAATATEAARVNANTIFKTAYPELASDKGRTLYTQQLVRAKLADPKNKGRDLEEIAVEAGDQALQDFGIRRTADATQQGNQAIAPELERRENAKRIGPFDPAPSVRAPAPAQAPAPKSRKDVVAGIRQARGQPKLD